MPVEVKLTYAQALFDFHPDYEASDEQSRAGRFMLHRSVNAHATITLRSQGREWAGHSDRMVVTAARSLVTLAGA